MVSRMRGIGRLRDLWVKLEAYKDILKNLDDVESYLLQESGLPGPRGNIELGKALAEVGDETLFKKLLKYTPDIAPVDSPQEFLAFCGTIGMGKILLSGDTRAFTILRTQASDPRWRTREAVAMALQMYGLKHMDLLLEEMENWARWKYAGAKSCSSCFMRACLTRR